MLGNIFKNLELGTGLQIRLSDARLGSRAASGAVIGR